MQQVVTMITAAFAQLHQTGIGGGGGTGGDRHSGEGGFNFKKGLIKHLHPYLGEKDLYNDWALKVFMNANAANSLIVEVLRVVEQSTEEIDLEYMNELEIKYPVSLEYHVKRWSRELFEVLGIKLESEAFTILKSVDNLNGFEVWRSSGKKRNRRPQLAHSVPL